MKKQVFVVVAMMALSACSSRYASNGESIYLRSRNGVKIEVPCPLTSTNISYFYDLPPQTQDPRVSIAPPAEVVTT